MKPVFVTTTDSVDGDIGLRNSYVDFWTMVRLSGFETCTLGEVDYKDVGVAYITTPWDGNVEANWTSEAARNRACKLILWQFEFPHKWEGGQPKENMGELLNGDGKVFDFVDKVWCSERFVIQLYWSFRLANNVRYVFFGGHPEYGGEPSGDKLWDFCDLSYRYGTREHKMKLLAQHGCTFAPTQVWGEEREKSLRHSSWGLQLHQFPMPFIAPQRFTLFASYKLPIVSDFCEASVPYKIFQEPLVHFNPKESVLLNDNIVRSMVRNNHRLVTQDATFKKEVLEGLKK